MTSLALELHDAGILWADASGVTSEPSPGYALWEDGTLRVGRAARHRARARPRWTHHRFWQDLDTVPLGRPFPRDLSSVDLVHAHLSQLRETLPADVSQILLAIPGCFSSDQLGLILGIARSCGLPIAGMVDAAAAATPIAATLGGHPGQRFLHLDVHLHRIVLTELEMSTPPGDAQEPWATVARRRVKVGDGAGLVALQDAWAQRIAELFVSATRFDPLHSASSEQALYDRLPEWLEAMRSQELIEITLGTPGKERRIELTRPDLVAAADGFYDALRSLVLSLKRAGESVTLLLARGVADLPGLEPRLAGLRGVSTVLLPAGAAAAGTLLAKDQILAGETDASSTADDALPFVTRLSFKATPALPPPGTPVAATAGEPTRTRPTHLVHKGLAYPITERPFWLGLAIGDAHGLELDGPSAGISRSHCSVVRRDAVVMVEDHSTYGSFVNGEQIHGQAALEAGDHLRLGTPGIEVQLIAVVTASCLHPSGATETN